MPPESDDHLHLQIGHVLFIDIVGYSRLLIEEQKERLNQLTAIVLATAPVREATDEQLVRLPTGDGMALVFHHSVEEPARCALEIAEALQKHPELPVRMGIHSGPVSEVKDVSGRNNIAGAGINMAQRVMDCGDAGHILLSQHVADDLVQYRQWAPRLHDLGDCEVKHGVRIHLVNLYAEPLGNAALPQKFQQAAEKPAVAKPARRFSLGWIAALALVVIALLTTDRYRRRPSSAPGIAEKSVAVLPFENLSSDKENAFFTDGVQDEILTNLAKIADLKVISRTSVMQYTSGAPRNLREIGQQLGVAHLLEGSVQRSGGKVRVNAQLIDARTDAHLWAQVYDRPLDDVFVIQSEISKAIADQLQAKLSPSEKSAIERAPTADISAFDLYTRGKALLFSTTTNSNSGPDLMEAADLLGKAVARDPLFVEAHCLLALAHDRIYFFGFDPAPARLELADAAIEAAARLRPDAGEVHLARANHRYRGYKDYDGALAEIELARRTLPNDARIPELIGYITRRRGKHEEALQHLSRALELDPRNFFILQQIAFSYQILRQYPEMANALDRALSIRPDDVGAQVQRASVDFYWKADTRPLHAAIDVIARDHPGKLATVADNWFLNALAERDLALAEKALAALGDNALGTDAVLLTPRFAEGLLARMTKDEAKAREAFTAARVEQENILQKQPDYAPALCVLGLIDAGLGRKEEALREGRRAIELLPVAKDSINGVRMIEFFAMTAAWVEKRSWPASS